LTGQQDGARRRRGGAGRSRRPVRGQVVEDAVLVALDDLVRAAEQMAQTITLVTTRAAEIRTCRQEGLSWRAIVGGEDSALIAGMLTETIARFEAAGTRFRQAEARALHQEGMTMEQIAELFRLTRQRVSVLLRTPSSR
jgi:hypothetical protein